MLNNEYILQVKTRTEPPLSSISVSLYDTTKYHVIRLQKRFILNWRGNVFFQYQITLPSREIPNKVCSISILFYKLDETQISLTITKLKHLHSELRKLICIFFQKLTVGREWNTLAATKQISDSLSVGLIIQLTQRLTFW